MKINYLDLFAGVGGFALGLKQAGFKFENHYFSEVDKYAAQCYHKNFPKAKGLGDIRTVRADTLPETINIISFGFPCQDISISGFRQGLQGNRSSLFFEAARLIREVFPTVFIFENVKGLLSIKKGLDFNAILQTISNIGIYECQWQLCNTKWFLPQNRERIYLVGFSGDDSLGKVFPLGHISQKTSKLPGQKVGTLTVGGNDTRGTYVVESKFVSQTRKNSQGNRIMSANKNAITLSSNGGGRGAKTGLYVVPRGNNKGGYRNTDTCPTITSSNFEWNNFIKNELAVRRLTPVECERLQGFPDGWTDGFSDTQRYKMLGNAVSVPIVKAIGKRILKLM
ncbi:MAG: DNA cytosine methyltransferase [Elusimicrobiota bacterium]|jgi:DNA (cytosine-5)-methyltransferase 1|nr:DNA cytosine methyltransferase [Elusimicrobiota bacterium]